MQCPSASVAERPVDFGRTTGRSVLVMVAPPPRSSELEWRRRRADDDGGGAVRAVLRGQEETGRRASGRAPELCWARALALGTEGPFDSPPPSPPRPLIPKSPRTDEILNLGVVYILPGRRF